MNVWIELAEASTADHVRFVFYWIAYEAGYQVRHVNSDNMLLSKAGSTSPVDPPPRTQFHRLMARRDAAGLQQLLFKHREPIATILKLRQAHPSFWDRWADDEDVRTKVDWETRFKIRVNSDVDRLNAAMRRGVSQDVARTLNDLFRNLSVVRNQIVHGGSAGGRSRGRTQVRLGAALLEDFVPRFRSAIERHRDEDWGMPPFPRVGDVADDKCLPPWLQADSARRGIEREHG